jgi:magnesium-transporting ATPase (P-type)
LRANILTRFNFILGVLLAVILVAGQPQDALFGIVLVANALIGIAQELRAKRTLDRLAVLSAPRVRVVRDGAPQDIAVADLVAGDLVDLRAGDQLVADGVVRASASLEADESLLTGESEPVGKRAGDRLLSGSFVVAGSGGYQATGVGADAYARKLATQARRFALVRSELTDGINRILRYVTWAIGPVAVLLVISGWHAHGNIRQVASGTVAALVGPPPRRPGPRRVSSAARGVRPPGGRRRGLPGSRRDHRHAASRLTQLASWQSRTGTHAAGYDPRPGDPRRSRYHPRPDPRRTRSPHPRRRMRPGLRST